ncbi:ATP synthase F0 subunit B [Peptacetobacter hominis]|uniref:ATP synthase subunit b n=1 Tax=Peptacetobacter hominis TaxID=2743610 RepID=A0A544QTH5_9FIRM|nr:F0F1 ATP synthase subunit B [Peptacetobacter hominis]TQQ83984.1 ATP synthase F0 subunit B [Peptacetobacter hominis]
MELKPLVGLTWEYFFQIVNTIVIFLILKYLLFKPVLKIIKEREEDIANEIREGERMKAEGAAYKAEYEEKIGGAEEEGRKIIETAVARAKEKSDMIIDDAKKDAELISQRAMREIEEEKIRSMNEMKGEMSNLVILAASKVLEDEIDEEKHRELIKDFIDRTGDAV